MNKDLIYIDVDDDITAIIGKVKDSKEKIVALVPPKRIGVLQSAVNLRLLQRVAGSGNKHLVLITSNPALIGLAASAKLPVARNAQTKPEIPEITALEIDNGEDIIDGAELPVGDHVRIGGDDSESSLDAAASDLIDRPKPAVISPSDSKLAAKKGPKVPDFNIFRKKLALIVAGVVGLIVFLVWALVLAPHATVVITARTSDVNVSKTVSVNPSGTTDFSAGTLKVIRQEQKKTESVDFEPTGKENKGDKATGTVTFSTSSADGLGTIPAGTKLTSSSGKVYTTDTDATLSPPPPFVTSVSDSVSITATEGGKSYNGATGSMSGAPNNVSADISDATTGGTDKIVSIVTAADVHKAAGQLATQEDPAIKAALKSAFGGDVIVIDTSYTLKKGDPVSSPAVGSETSGQAKLTTEITYSILGVAKDEAKKYLDAAVNDAIADQPDQRMYDNGLKKVTFTDFATEGKTAKVRIVANGKVGPQIKDDEIKEKVKGKRFGDVQADLEAIQGVEDVDVRFFPFWVRTIPADDKKITIEFKVNDR